MNACIFYIEYWIICNIYIYNITNETSVMNKYIASTRKYSFYFTLFRDKQYQTENPTATIRTK